MTRPGTHAQPPAAHMRPSGRGLPRSWRLLTQYWGVSQRQAQRWWGALQQSPTPACRGLRQALLGEHETTLLPPQLLERIGPPARLCGTLEALVSVGLLTRREASRIEDRVLTHVDPQGCWR